MKLQPPQAGKQVILIISLCQTKERFIVIVRHYLIEHFSVVKRKLNTQLSQKKKNKTGGGDPAPTSAATSQLIQQKIQGQDTDSITFLVTPGLKPSENTQFRYFPN